MTQVKELLFEDDARLKLREGITKLADVAGVTLGPVGLHVGLQEGLNTPTITSDGHTVIKNLELKDQFTNMGASIAREAAAKMKEICGDGTTSTILLLRALVSSGLKNIGAGANPIDLKRGMEKGVIAILKELDLLAQPVAEILPTAISSASGDPEIGAFIAQALQKVGREGVVIIENGQTIDTRLEMVDGLKLDRGYLSPYFSTEMYNPAILITDMTIHSIQEILPLIQTAAHAGLELLIIAGDLHEDVISTLVINKLRGTLKVCAIKAPHKEILQDLAALTGATVISADLGLSLTEATADVLGTAQKAVISKNSTILTSNKAAPSSGVAIIYVGATTDLEMHQKKQLFEDSLNSTKAALESGIVPGGGIALLRASQAPLNLSLTGDELTGLQIVLKACEAPFRQIVQNSNCDSSLLLEQVLSKQGSWGFNALTQQVEDLTQSGIVDPCKIIKHSLTIALSSASLILLADVLIGHDKC